MSCVDELVKLCFGIGSRNSSLLGHKHNGCQHCDFPENVPEERKERKKNTHQLGEVAIFVHTETAGIGQIQGYR